MADFITFYEGSRYIGTAAIPATLTLDLSTKSVDATTPFVDADTYSSRSAITGTGYGQLTYTGFTNTGGTFATIQGTWTTGANTDWSSTARSCVVSTGTGTLLWAWNLQTGGAARDLSGANTTEIVQGTVIIG